MIYKIIICQKAIFAAISYIKAAVKAIRTLSPMFSLNKIWPYQYGVKPTFFISVIKWL